MGEGGRGGYTCGVHVNLKCICTDGKVEAVGLRSVEEVRTVFEM